MKQVKWKRPIDKPQFRVEPYCGKCEAWIGEGAAEWKYCPFCGEEIDWEEET